MASKSSGVFPSSDLGGVPGDSGASIDLIDVPTASVFYVVSTDLISANPTINNIRRKASFIPPYDIIIHRIQIKFI